MKNPIKNELMGSRGAVIVISFAIALIVAMPSPEAKKRGRIARKPPEEISYSEHITNLRNTICSKLMSCGVAKNIEECKDALINSDTGLIDKEQRVYKARSEQCINDIANLQECKDIWLKSVTGSCNITTLKTEP
jgi:histone acetyltransferase (RNA polymerase elongator complex component)